MLIRLKTVLFCAAISALFPVSAIAQDAVSEEPQTSVQENSSDDNSRSGETGGQPEASDSKTGQGLTSDIDAFFDEIDEDGQAGDLDTSCSQQPEEDKIA